MNSLFETEDPREWLVHIMAERAISQQQMAGWVGVSKSQLNNHLSRRRTMNLSREEAVIAALALEGAFAQQYRSLVTLDRARGVRAQERARAQVLAGQRRHRGEQVVTAALPGPLDLEAAVIRELAGVQGYRPVPDWIATTLDPPRRPSEVEAWQAQLQRSGLAPRTPAGRVGPGPALHLHTEGAPADAGILRAARAAALAAFDRVSHEERLFGVLFQAIPARALDAVREELAWLQDRVLARCETARTVATPGRRVFALLTQLVPLTRTLSDAAPTRPLSPPPPEVDEPPPWRTGDPEPSLYSSLDYRRFLADWRSHRELTLEQVAIKLRRHLPEGEELARQQIHAILSRAAHIRPEHVDAWARALELGVGDARYLGAVLAWHLADDPVERARCWAELLPYQQMGLGWRISQYSEAFLRSALPSTLLELARHPAFSGDPDWIQGVLNRAVPREEIVSALELLQALNYLAPTPSGQLVPAMGTLHTEDAALTRAATRALFHDVAMLGEAAADPACAMDLLIQAVPDAALAAVRADQEETRLRIQGLMDAALEGRAQGQAATLSVLPERVWLISLQWFPLSRPVAKRL